MRIGKWFVVPFLDWVDLLIENVPDDASEPDTSVHGMEVQRYRPIFGRRNRLKGALLQTLVSKKGNDKPYKDTTRG
jgi:hypothetical protein